MLTKEETATLKNYLALAPNPEESFTFEELEGYLFGLAMTPGLLLSSQWLPVIFGDDMPTFDPLGQVEEMHNCLIQVYNRQVAHFHDKKLTFPFNLNELDSAALEDLYAWVSGFEEAITLFEELWDPEEYDYLSEQQAQQLYHSLMTIEGLVDPYEVMDFFENMPSEAFLEVFPQGGDSSENRELQIQMFLLASLPLAIETLQNHSKSLESIATREDKKRKIEKAKNASRKGKSNIIEVDFGQKK
ncbi:YecA family protein [Desulforhopalus sp. IMCC35007]|uniref:YecA/YgfB family protein n=1 Tax=Desulforhopalus sp. IMCC35007 TaxID=2569543 RepID=UPI0010AE1A26|nr:YecA family protein [Desulforhopalus sp. IMCC35007]TKB07644.1 YecA family protein [Desulforhopalus sp. IMCC35007]